MGQSKDDQGVFNFRMKKDLRELLEKAVRVKGTNLSSFISSAARAEAENTLMDQRHFMVAEDRYEEFLNVLDEPVSSNPELKKLLDRPSPWE
jgi:uncharacterized protein (DUF1778 family)